MIYIVSALQMLILISGESHIRLNGKCFFHLELPYGFLQNVTS